MAELLVKAVDYVPDDPALEAEAFKRGDVVAALPDGNPWGTDELDTSKFYVIRIPGADPADFDPYLEPELEYPDVPMDRFGVALAAVLDGDDGDGSSDEDDGVPPPPVPQLVRMRAWHGEGLPAELKAALEAGPVEMTWEELRDYIRRKNDGAAPEED